MRTTIITLLMLGLLPLSAAGQDTPRVWMAFLSHEPTAEPIMTSCIRRELRALQVSMVEETEDADYGLGIHIISLTESNQRLGYAIAPVYVSYDLEGGAPRYRGSRLIAGDINDLQWLCQSVVAHFDNDVLESDRQADAAAE